MPPEDSSFRQLRPVRARAEVRWRLRMNAYFKSLGLPTLTRRMLARNRLEPPATELYTRWCRTVGGGPATPMPIMTSYFKLRVVARPGAQNVFHWQGPAASARCNPSGLRLACEEVVDSCRDLPRMGLEREVARIEEMDYGTGNIAPERLSTPRQEKGIVLSPDR